MLLCGSMLPHNSITAAWISIQPADLKPPIQSDITLSHRCSKFSPYDGHMDAQNMYRREINKYTKQNCAPSWICLRDYAFSLFEPHEDSQFSVQMMLVVLGISNVRVLFLCVLFAV